MLRWQSQNCFTSLCKSTYGQGDYPSLRIRDSNSFTFH